MKTKSSSIKAAFTVLIIAGVHSLMAPRAEGQTLYWDGNGITAGAGATPDGTWGGIVGESPFWSVSSAGTVVTTIYVPGSDAVFSAGTDATGSYTVTLSGTQSAATLTVEEGAVTITGGTALNLTGTGGNVTVNSGSSAAISSVLGGTAGLTKLGAGTLTLSGSNTFTGATTVTGGKLAAGAAGALGGTASVTVNNSGTLLLSGSGAIDRVNASAPVNLAGGTLSMAGLGSSSETLGALTLTADSIIDFGTGNGDTLHFASLALNGHSLRIDHWTGALYSPTDTADNGDASQDRLLFDSASLSPSELAQISFFDDAGVFRGTGLEIKRRARGAKGESAWQKMIAWMRHKRKLNALFSEQVKVSEKFNRDRVKFRRNSDEEGSLMAEAAARQSRIRDEIETEVTRYLVQKAERLQLQLPGHGDRTMWEESPFSGRDLLTQQGIAAVSTSIRRKRQGIFRGLTALHFGGKKSGRRRTWLGRVGKRSSLNRINMHDPRILIVDDDSSPLVEKLQPLLADKNDYVRRAARKAIGQLQCER